MIRESSDWLFLTFFSLFYLTAMPFQREWERVGGKERERVWFLCHWKSRGQFNILSNLLIAIISVIEGVVAFSLIIGVCCSHIRQSEKPSRHVRAQFFRIVWTFKAFHLARADGQIKWNNRSFVFLFRPDILLLFIIRLPCHVGFLCLNCSSTCLCTQLLSSELCVIKFGSLFIVSCFKDCR